MSKARSFRLARPACPECHADGARLVHSPGNWARIAADVVLGLFFVPAFSYKWKCGKCGAVFRVED